MHMYISEKYKCHWWGPPRTASRATSMVATKLGFVDYGISHGMEVIDPTWSIILNIRNPYSRTVSWWILRNGTNDITMDKKISFSDFVTNHNEFLDLNYDNNWHELGTLKRYNTKPTYLVRHENLFQDLLQIPFIKENQTELSELLDMIQDGKKPWQTNYLEQYKKPYHSYYTQELADIVYQKRTEDFEMWGYDKNSWKTIIE